MTRTILICSKANSTDPNFAAPLRQIVNTYVIHKGAPRDSVKLFVSPNITLPDVNNEMMCTMMIWTGFMANGMGQPDGMNWDASLYQEGGYYFVVFDINHS